MRFFTLRGSCLFIGLMSAVALGQAEISIVAPGGSNIVGPDGQINIEMRVNNIINPNRLRAYQVTLRITPQAGATGTLTLADTVSPPQSNTSVRVNTSRSDWVFFGTTSGSFPVTNVQMMQIAATLLSPSDAPNVITAKYLGDYTLKASSNALGNFLLDFVLTDPGNPDARPTQLISQDGLQIPFSMSPSTGFMISVVNLAPNDNCANSLPIFDGATAFTTQNATTDGPSHPGTVCDVGGVNTILNDIWYDYTSSCSGILVVDTCNDANFDTRVAVYDQCTCPLAAGDLLSCNDNGAACSAGTSEAVVSGVVAGACYKVRVGSTFNLFGTGEINIACIDNDTCATARSVSIGANVAGTTRNAAANDAVGPNCGGGLPTAPGVWYTVAGTGQRMTATLSNAAFDSRLTVYQGACGSLTCVGEANVSGGSGESVSWCSQSGTTYRVLVHGSGTASGSFTVNVGSQTCDDSNACTSNACSAGTCVFTPTYNTTTQCCNPTNANLTTISDGNPCTTDTCNTATGSVTHSPAPNGPNVACDDGSPCTEDACQNGNCAHNDVNGRACTTNAQCPGGVNSSCINNQCVCISATLELDPEPGSPPVAGCYAVGDQLVVHVMLGPENQVNLTPTDIVGAQFFLEYDPATLDFVAMDPGNSVDPTSPFVLEFNQTVNEVLGRIDYVVGVDFGTGTRQPTTVAVITFDVVAECSAFLRYRSSGPGGAPNALAMAGGGQVDPILIGMNPISIADSPPSIAACPATIVTVPDPGLFTAAVSWATPTATDSCIGGPVPVQCLPLNGSNFAGGVTAVTCTATTDCGITDSCTFDVIVEEPVLTTNLQLSPTVANGSFTRCIEFELRDCDGPPGGEFAVVKQPVTFTAGQANGINVLIPGGDWECLTVRDPLHSVRSTPLNFGTLNGVDFSASVTGARSAGGHWLVGGNLNGDDFIDIFDFAMFFPIYLRPAGASTTCTTTGPDGNMNGDTLIDLLDLVFISGNSLSTSEPSCCGGAAASTSAPRSAASLEELARKGYGDLSSYDIDRNGVFNFQDVSALAAGAEPIMDTRPDLRDPSKTKRPGRRIGGR